MDEAKRELRVAFRRSEDVGNAPTIAQHFYLRLEALQSYLTGVLGKRKPQVKIGARECSAAEQHECSTERDKPPEPFLPHCVNSVISKWLGQSRSVDAL